MESIFCVEQVNVPPELGTIMKQYTKAVLRDRPQDLYKYSANFFAALCGQAAPFDKDGQYVESCEQETMEHFAGAEVDKAEAVNPISSVGYEETDAVREVFNNYGVNGNGRLTTEKLPALLADLQRAVGLNESEAMGKKDILDLLETDENGAVDLLELRQLFFQSVQLSLGNAE
ncbi:cAMP-dependent protein kinase dimerization/docking domain [Trypanosoma rangeli]|uniref:cAMP-dependent protein kinase dimerization/docking domain n=1 Tax=Trypanosoma rangeli TaxID=5698 RepID=A0A3R7KW38_TRYRA|nr:cAMP-dependent protein kinase dimerization/docking domain [Trypanosoma rangeli]RNF10868.1 cAMP-dependent protein kinase dimerization/docking domain [Trypanosoma rangeli]|eukprot:RNF10868.1 cAMP-dependent protein kinase dimerization/docking domain [Trypanosoma rangeli]